MYAMIAQVYVSRQGGCYGWGYIYNRINVHTILCVLGSGGRHAFLFVLVHP